MEHRNLTIKIFKTIDDKQKGIPQDVEVDALYLGNGIYLHEDSCLKPIDPDNCPHKAWTFSVDCGLKVYGLIGSLQEAKTIGKILTKLDWTGITPDTRPRDQYVELVREAEAMYELTGWTSNN